MSVETTDLVFAVAAIIARPNIGMLLEVRLMVLILEIIFLLLLDLFVEVVNHCLLLGHISKVIGDMAIGRDQVGGNVSRSIV